MTSKILDKLNPLKLVSRAIGSVKRFPLSVSAIAITGVSLYILILYSLLSDSSMPDRTEKFFGRVIFASILAFFVFTATKLALENRKLPALLEILFNIFAGIFLIIYGIFLTPIGSTNPYEVLLFTTLIVSSLSAVYTVPFLLKKNTRKASWHFIMSHLTKSVIATIIGQIAFGAISLALLAIGMLFEIDQMPSEWSALIANTIFVLILPVIYLIFIPKDFQVKKEFKYPKLVFYLIKFIAIPIIGFYFIILYLYIAKTLISWELPEGGVVYLMLSMIVPVIGIVELLNPLKDTRKRIRVFTRVAYLLLIPLIILYFVAIGVRIGDFGVTVARYYVVLFGVDILFVAIYCALRIKSSVNFLLIVFCGSLLISVLPFAGAYDFSQHWQEWRFEQVFKKKDLLEENKKIDLDSELVFSEAEGIEINGILDYLEENHDFTGVGEMFEDNDWDKLNIDEKDPDYSDTGKLLDALGIKRCYDCYDNNMGDSERVYVHISLNNYQAYELDSLDFKKMLTIRYDSYRGESEQTLDVYYSEDSSSDVNVWIEGESKLIISHSAGKSRSEFELEPAVESAVEDNSYSLSYVSLNYPLIVESENGDQLVIENMSFNWDTTDKEIIDISAIGGWFLIK